MLIGRLSPERIAEIEKRMRPGAASLSGFLGPDERLADVIARDEAACAARGIRPEQIADRLDSLVASATRQCREPRALTTGHVAGGFRTTGIQYRGTQSCPYGCAAASDSDYAVEHLRSKRRLEFPGLITHLVRAHHFFEGSVPYRLDPVAAIEVLGLEPGVDYAPRHWSRSHEAYDDDDSLRPERRRR